MCPVRLCVHWVDHYLLSSSVTIASTPACIRPASGPLRRAVSCCARESTCTSESSRASSETDEPPRPLSASVHARLVSDSERVRQRLLCRPCLFPFPCYVQSLLDLIENGPRFQLPLVRSLFRQLFLLSSLTEFRSRSATPQSFPARSSPASPLPATSGRHCLSASRTGDTAAFH